MQKQILGIELGSTRIKSVLIDSCGSVLASGSHDWENSLIAGLWTYSLDSVWAGLQNSYKNLKMQYFKLYKKELDEIASIGISAMMHGYLAFDGQDNLLTPFRTWRNTNTQQASTELTELLDFNIPIRWSVSHYYQAILNCEPHVKDVEFLTTLAGYVHYKLTGKKVLGIGDASGMFPIKNGDYDKNKIATFNALTAKKGITKDLYSLLPRVLVAGENAGTLTKSGALLLDPSGELKGGCVMCPPEGDAGTGMVATNSIKPNTGNVSAGTSAFVMAVLEQPLKSYYPQIDVVTTPSGIDVAMAHVNNFTSEINEWISLFGEVVALGDGNVDGGKFIERLFNESANSDGEIGGLIGYNFLSGEPIVGLNEGRPLIARSPNGNMNLANFMQMQIYSALGGLKLGMEILEREGVKLNEICGHGGFFKTPKIGQSAMSAALNAPVAVMTNAGEGGAWGIALLALFTVSNSAKLEEFLDDIFKSTTKTIISADKTEKEKFGNFMQRYKACIKAEKEMAEVLK